MLNFHFQLLNNRVIFLVIACLILTFVIDITYAVSYNLLNKATLPTEIKKIIFVTNIVISLILQFICLLYSGKLTGKRQQGNKLRLKVFEKIGQFAFYFIVVNVIFLIFQLFYLDYYYSITLK